MEYIFAFAGIPSIIFDEVKEQFSQIAKGKCTFISRPLNKDSYDKSDSAYYISEFARHLSNDRENKLGNSKFSIIYIDYGDEKSEQFSKSFFPFLLSAAVSWNLNRTTNQKINESKNELIKLLTEIVKQTKTSLNLIRKEITEKLNKTPLILPIRNFESDILRESIYAIYSTIVREQHKINFLEVNVKNIKFHHPPQRIGRKNLECFVDDKHIEFHAPGKNLHGKSRSNSGHPEECLLSGNIRLGTKYPSGFHFDCNKGNANLIGVFWGCHTAQQKEIGKPHLNIFPNDHIR